jgi:hypothetical protein
VTEGPLQTFSPSAILSTCGKGTIDMNNTTVGFDFAEEDILTYEVSDEAIESAACSLRDKPASATISFCSGLDSCPS